MKNHFGKISLGLWIISFFIIGYHLYFGKTGKSTDGRTAVYLSQDEKDLVLREMRTLLVSVNGILEGLSKDDFEKAAGAASAAGMGLVESLENQEKKILLKLPVEFKKLGLGTHTQFDNIAEMIRKKENLKTVLSEMDILTKKCTACHAGYRIEIEKSD